MEKGEAWRSAAMRSDCSKYELQPSKTSRPSYAKLLHCGMVRCSLVTLPSHELAILRETHSESRTERNVYPETGAPILLICQHMSRKIEF